MFPVSEPIHDISSSKSFSFASSCTRCILYPKLIFQPLDHQGLQLTCGRPQILPLELLAHLALAFQAPFSQVDALYQQQRHGIPCVHVRRLVGRSQSTHHTYATRLDYIQSRAVFINGRENGTTSERSNRGVECVRLHEQAKSVDDGLLKLSNDWPM